MKEINVYKRKKWLTVLGAFLIVFPVGVPWYWGNVSVYASSYILNRFPSTENVESPWVMPLSMIGYFTGIVTAAVLSRLISKRLTVLLGIVVFNAGWIGSYVAIQNSFIAMNLVSGLVISNGDYVINGMTTSIVVEWCRRDVGKVNAIVQSGFTAGALVYNQMVTLYVNPKDLSPDRELGPSKFFSQDEVLNRVTNVFLIIAAVSFVVSLVGLLFITEHASKKCDLSSECLYGVNQQTSGTRDIESIPIVEALQKTYSDLTKTSATWERNDVSPKQALRSGKLYIYWILFIMAEIPYIVLTNYYKSYGQIGVPDDYFLTDLSTVLLVFITLSRPLWGLLLDELGPKVVFIVFYSICSTFSLLFYFSLFLNKWSFGFMTVAFGCAVSPLFVLFCFVIVESFGKRYFLYNLGIVMFPTLFTNVALPTVLESLLLHLGWFSIFAFSSSCSLIGLIVSVIFL